MNARVRFGAVLVGTLFVAFPWLQAEAWGAAAPQEFKVRIENVSKEDTLKPSNGAKAPAAVAPGVWVIHRTTDLLFTSGKPDRAKASRRWQRMETLVDLRSRYYSATRQV